MMVLTYSVTTRAIERGPQLKSKRVSLQQRGKRASQAKAKSSRILNSAQGLQLEHTDLAAQELCKTKPRDSTTDRQAAASFNSPPCPYKRPSGCEGYYNPLLLQFYCLCSNTAKLSFSDWGYMQAAQMSHFSQEALAWYLLFQIRFKSLVFSFKDTRQAA